MIAIIGCVFLLKLQLLKITNRKNIPYNELSLVKSIFAISEVSIRERGVYFPARIYSKSEPKSKSKSVYKIQKWPDECIVKLQYELSFLLGYDAASLGICFQNFRVSKLNN